MTANDEKKKHALKWTNGTKKNRKQIYAHKQKYIKKGHIDIAKLLIAKGASVNKKAAFDGTIPLQKAASHNKPEMCQFLIENGANINAADMLGRTPLMDAAEIGKNMFIFFYFVWVIFLIFYFAIGFFFFICANLREIKKKAKQKQKQKHKQKKKDDRYAGSARLNKAKTEPKTEKVTLSCK